MSNIRQGMVRFVVLAWPLLVMFVLNLIAYRLGLLVRDTLMIAGHVLREA